MYGACIWGKADDLYINLNSPPDVSLKVQRELDLDITFGTPA